MLLFLLTLADEKYSGRVKELYCTYSKEMYKIAKVILKDRDNSDYEAEEALQNVFVKIIRNMDSIYFEKADEEVKSLCFTIVANEARSIRDRRIKTVSLDETETEIDDYDFLTGLGIREDYERVVCAIMELDDIYSIPLRLKYVEEMSVKEISKVLDENIHTVYSRINRGKIILRKKLGKEMSDYE